VGSGFSDGCHLPPRLLAPSSSCGNDDDRARIWLSLKSLMDRSCGCSKTCGCVWRKSNTLVFLARGSGVLSGKCESDFAASTVPSYCGDPPRKFSLDGRPIAIQWCPQSDSPKATRSETRKQQPAPGVCLYSYILSCTRDSSTEKFDPPELGRVSGFKYRLVQMIRCA
jgi:hypothetical protein